MLHEVRPSAWNTWSDRPASRTSTVSLRIGRGVDRASGRGSLDAADLLRQLVYLPNASLLVAEARRELVGGALLVLRPSVVAGGYVGTIDLLVVAPDHDADRVTDALLEELLRSASNKGCSTVEAAEPSDPADLARLERAGLRHRRANALAVRRGGRCRRRRI